MHVVITHLLTAAMMIVVVFTMAGDMLITFRDVGESWEALQARSQRRIDTRLAGPIGLSVSATSTVQITLANEGKVTIGRFSDWDVIFEVQEDPGLGIAYLTYTENPSPAANQWTAQGIFLNASSTPEFVDPGLLNPGEDIVVLANPSPSVKAGTYDRATFVTPEGTAAKVIFEVVP